MNGLVVADVKLIKMMDKNLEAGDSKIVPASITQKGEVGKKPSIISSDQFKILQKYITKTIKSISKEILNGKIDIKPYYKNKSTPCGNCSYRAICQFDKNKFCNEYNYLPKLSDEEVWEKLSEES